MFWREPDAQRLSSTVIILSLAVFYFRFLSGKAFGISDDLYIFFPASKFFAESIASGTFPFWMPGMRLGLALYANVELSYFFPLKWILLCFVRDGELSQTGYQWYLVFRCFLGVGLLYTWLRMKRFDAAPALLGSIVFCFSGYIALHSMHVAAVGTVLMFPLALIAVDYFLKRQCLFRLLLIPLALVMLILAGFPQLLVYLSYFLCGYWLISNVYLRIEKKKSGKKIVIGALCDVGLMVLVYAIAALMSMVILIPGQEYWAMSTRVEYGFDKIASDSMPLRYLVHMFFPNITGVFGVTPSDGIPSYWGFNRDCLDFATYGTAYWHYWSFSCYAGQLAVAALLYHLAFAKNWIKQPLRLITVLGCVFSVWFMLGRYGGLFNVLYHVLPGVSLFRTPARMSALLHILMAVLSAFFIQDMFNGQRNLQIRRFLFSMLGVYLIFFVGLLSFGKSVCDAFSNNELFYFSVKQTLVGTGFLSTVLIALLLLQHPKTGAYGKCIFTFLLFFTFLDLYLAHHRFHQGKQSAEQYFSDKNGLIEQMNRIKQKTDPFRFAQGNAGSIGEMIVLPRNIGFFYDIEVPEGYNAFVMSAQSRVRRLPSSVLMDLLNVGVYAERDNSGRVGIKMMNPIFPRTKYYSNIVGFNSYDELAKAVHDHEIDYRNQLAVLNADTVLASTIQASGTTSIRKINNNKSVVSYDTTAPGCIFVSQIYYPGWQATTTSGEKLNIIEAFGGLTAIELPVPGKGEIELKFSPQSFVVGSTISLSTFAVVLVALVLSRRNRKQ